jgi:hypothetical protein
MGKFSGIEMASGPLRPDAGDLLAVQPYGPEPVVVAPQHPTFTPACAFAQWIMCNAEIKALPRRIQHFCHFWSWRFIT